MNSLKPGKFGTEIRVSISKGKGHFGNFTLHEDLLRRLHIRKEEDLGMEKQRRPLEDERRVDGNESEVSHHEFKTVLKRGYFWWRKCGWERRIKDEKGDDECFVMKKGEKRMELKCLQVDLRVRNVFKGRNESTCSRRWSGSLLHIRGSIFV